MPTITLTTMQLLWFFNPVTPAVDGRCFFLLLTVCLVRLSVCWLAASLLHRFRRFGALEYKGDQRNNQKMNKDR